MSTKDALGAWGEEYAARYLKQAGFEIVCRNWRSAAGEVDLLLRRADLLVVCEVKTRRSHSHGHPDEAVDARRMSRLIAAAELIAASNSGMTVRIDVVSITADNHAIVVQHRESVAA